MKSFVELKAIEKAWKIDSLREWNRYILITSLISFHIFRVTRITLFFAFFEYSNPIASTQLPLPCSALKWLTMIWGKHFANTIRKGIGCEAVLQLKRFSFVDFNWIFRQLDSHERRASILIYMHFDGVAQNRTESRSAFFIMRMENMATVDIIRFSVSSSHASHHRRIDRASVRLSRSGLGICSFS